MVLELEIAKKNALNHYSLFRGKSRTDLFMAVKRPRMANCSYGRLPQGATSPIWHNWSSAVYRLSLSTKERRFRLAGNNFLREEHFLAHQQCIFFVLCSSEISGIHGSVNSSACRSLWCHFPTGRAPAGWSLVHKPHHFRNLREVSPSPAAAMKPCPCTLFLERTVPNYPPHPTHIPLPLYDPQNLS